MSGNCVNDLEEGQLIIREFGNYEYGFSEINDLTAICFCFE